VGSNPAVMTHGDWSGVDEANARAAPLAADVAILCRTHGDTDTRSS
jgi:hypothetical protein